MLKASEGFFVLAMFLLLKFVSITQIGPGWEIPYAIYQKSKLIWMLGLLSLIISSILMLYKRTLFIKNNKLIRTVYLLLLILSATIATLGFTDYFYQLPVSNRFISFLCANVFSPGVIVVIIFILGVRLANRSDCTKTDH